MFSWNESPECVFESRTCFCVFSVFLSTLFKIGLGAKLGTNLKEEGGKPYEVIPCWISVSHSELVVSMSAKACWLIDITPPSFPQSSSGRVKWGSLLLWDPALLCSLPLRRADRWGPVAPPGAGHEQRHAQEQHGHAVHRRAAYQHCQGMM